MRRLLPALLLLAACEKSKPAAPPAAADAARPADAGAADAARLPDAAPPVDAAVPDAVPPPAIPAELGLRGCLGVSPDGRAAMLAIDAFEGDDPEAELKVSRRFEVVAVPGVDVSTLPDGASVGECVVKGETFAAGALPAACRDAFVEGGKEMLPEVTAALRKARWTPCIAAAPVGDRWELPVGGRRVAFGGKPPLPPGLHRASVPGFRRAFTAPQSPHVFAVFEAGEVPPLQETPAVVTAEELGLPRCLPRAATLGPPSPTRFDLAAADSRCRLVHSDGRHAIFTTEEDKCTEDGDCQTRINHAWIGEPLATLPKLYATSLEKNQDYRKMFACEPVPDVDTAPTYLITEQSRVWIKVPGQEPRWVVTLRGEHHTLAGAYTGGAATTLFIDEFFDDLGERHSEAGYRTREQLGLGACPPASQPASAPASAPTR